MNIFLIQSVTLEARTGAKADKLWYQLSQKVRAPRLGIAGIENGSAPKAPAPQF